MYPVSYAADVPIEGRNRLTTFFRYLMAIPGFIVLMIFGIGVYFTAFFAWCAIVFTGKYPEGLYDFNAKFVRLSARVGGYVNLLTDESPPLNGDPDDSYPIRVDIPPRLESYDRLKTGLRLLYGIPVMLLGYVQGIIASVVALIAWVAIVVAGRMPAGLVDPLRSASAYSVRATAYFLLLTEDWPPFSLEGGQDAAGQLQTESTETVK